MKKFLKSVQEYFEELLGGYVSYASMESIRDHRSYSVMKSIGNS